MRRALTVGGLLVITAAVVAALWLSVDATGTHPAASTLSAPQMLAGGALVASVRGPAALQEIDRLHGKRIDAADALVARYAGGITVWISASPSSLKAAALLFQMNRRIAGGSDVFAAPQTRQLSGRTVFTTTGLGQRHYYYQSGHTVIWLAAPAPLADDALQTLLMTYP